MSLLGNITPERAQSFARCLEFKADLLEEGNGTPNSPEHRRQQIRDLRHAAYHIRQQEYYLLTPHELEEIRNLCADVWTVQTVLDLAREHGRNEWGPRSEYAC